MNEIIQLTTEAPTSIEQSPLKGVAKKIAEAKERHAREIELLEKMGSLIDKLPDDIADKCNVYGVQIDIDSLTREQAVSVMGILHAGKWTKNINATQPTAIDYETTIDSVKVRLWAAGPPNSCRVVEFEEELPATKIIRRRLVCSDKEAL